MASIKALKDSNNETVYPQTLTNAVFDLSNQSLDTLLALKIDASRVYTKEEINNIVNTLSSLKFEVLQKNEDETIPDLPAVGDTDTIYLRPKENDDTNNYYDEYIYLENGVYEKIGDTKVDLSNYYTKTEADGNYAKLSLYSDTTINIGRKSDTVAGPYSVAEGYNNTASKMYSHAEGFGTTASGAQSHAEGYNTTASGDNSHTEGFGTTASGRYSHAEGYNATASQDCSHAEGANTTASGPYSHAEGAGAKASGSHSHAEGGATTASGTYSHAEGISTTASKEASHAEGFGTTASGDYQHVQGKYNVVDSNGAYAHIVGNGLNNAERSNAHTLDWDGNAWFEGSIKCGGTKYDDAPNNVITSGSVVKVWTGTQTEYDALATKDATTLYMITG